MQKKNVFNVGSSINTITNYSPTTDDLNKRMNQMSDTISVIQNQINQKNDSSNLSISQINIPDFIKGPNLFSSESITYNIFYFNSFDELISNLQSPNTNTTNSSDIDNLSNLNEPFYILIRQSNNPLITNLSSALQGYNETKQYVIELQNTFFKIDFKTEALTTNNYFVYFQIQPLTNYVQFSINPFNSSISIYEANFDVELNIGDFDDIVNINGSVNLGTLINSSKIKANLINSDKIICSKIRAFDLFNAITSNNGSNILEINYALVDDKYEYLFRFDKDIIINDQDGNEVLNLSPYLIQGYFISLSANDETNDCFGINRQLNISSVTLTSSIPRTSLHIPIRFSANLLNNSTGFTIENLPGYSFNNSNFQSDNNINNNLELYNNFNSYFILGNIEITDSLTNKKKYYGLNGNLWGNINGVNSQIPDNFIDLSFNNNPLGSLEFNNDIDEVVGNLVFNFDGDFLDKNIIPICTEPIVLTDYILKLFSATENNNINNETDITIESEKLELTSCNINLIGNTTIYGNNTINGNLIISGNIYNQNGIVLNTLDNELLVSTAGKLTLQSSENASEEVDANSYLIRTEIGNSSSKDILINENGFKFSSPMTAPGIITNDFINSYNSIRVFSSNSQNYRQTINFNYYDVKNTKYRQQKIKLFSAFEINFGPINSGPNDQHTINYLNQNTTREFNTILRLLSTGGTFGNVNLENNLLEWYRILLPESYRFQRMSVAGSGLNFSFPVISNNLNIPPSNNVDKFEELFYNPSYQPNTDSPMLSNTSSRMPRNLFSYVISRCQTHLTNGPLEPISDNTGTTINELYRLYRYIGDNKNSILYFRNNTASVHGFINIKIKSQISSSGSRAGMSFLPNVDLLIRTNGWVNVNNNNRVQFTSLTSDWIVIDSGAPPQFNDSINKSNYLIILPTYLNNTNMLLLNANNNITLQTDESATNAISSNNNFIFPQNNRQTFNTNLFPYSPFEYFIVKYQLKNPNTAFIDTETPGVDSFIEMQQTPGSTSGIYKRIGRSLVSFRLIPIFRPSSNPNGSISMNSDIKITANNNTISEIITNDNNLDTTTN